MRWRGPRARAVWARAITIVVLALGAAAPAAAAEPATAIPVRRTVIALYDGPLDPLHPETENPVAQVLEMPLNWLGLVVRTRHLSEGPPPESWLADARGVLTWIQDAGRTPPWLWRWLETEVPARRLRVVHLEALPAEAPEDGPQPRLTRWLRRLGLAWRGGYVGARARVEVEFLAGDACRLERDPRRSATHEGPESVDPDNRVWVRTRDREHPEDERTPVVTGAWGGIALAPWTVLQGEREEQRRWSLDPFRFLRAALGLAGLPAPDPSVQFGRRLFVFHLDGDGFESVSLVDGKSLCADVMRTEVLERFRLPCTVSVIVASLTGRIDPPKPTARMALAKRIFALPYVEAASHGTLHPYAWDVPWSPEPRVLARFGYPRLAGFRYSPVEEVRASVRFLRRYLLPLGHAPLGMLWTGDCLPPAAAIAAADDLGCWNLNGGTFRWDTAFDSVGFVSPWARRVGERIQVHTGAGNENEYPGFFREHPAAFQNVATTIERTGRGRILKPANVYAHFYSAERPARLRVLEGLIQRFAFEAPTLPVPASVYAAAVQGALALRLARLPDGFRIVDAGGCRTLRLDDTRLAVDFTRSRGLVGARRIGSSLFVALGADEARVVLGKAPPPAPHVVESNHRLADVALSSAGVSFQSEARHAPRLVVLGGFVPGGRATLRIGAAARTLEADAEGRISVRLAAGGPDRVEVTRP